MKVFLRLSAAGLYYAGQELWVRDRQHALDLKTIKRAAEVGHAQELNSIVIVISSGDPSADWFVPLPRRQEVGPFSTTPANPPTPLPKAA